MKKIIPIIAAVILLPIMLSFGACSPAPSASPGAPSDASAKTQLIMATEAGFMPYEYLDGTSVVGVDVDVANEIAKETGLELVIEEMEFSSIVAAVKAGKADFGAAGLSITEERLIDVDFSVEYATSKQIILTKAEYGISGPADLDGKDVGVQLGTTGDFELSDNYPNVNVAQYNKYADAANDLTLGRIQAIVMDVLPAQELLSLNDDFIILEEELLTDSYAICVRKGNQELLDTINKVLNRLIAEGKIDEFTTNHTS